MRRRQERTGAGRDGEVKQQLTDFNNGHDIPDDVQKSNKKFEKEQLIQTLLLLRE